VANCSIQLQPIYIITYKLPATATNYHKFFSCHRSSLCTSATMRPLFHDKSTNISNIFPVSMTKIVTEIEEIQCVSRKFKDTPSHSLFSLMPSAACFQFLPFGISCNGTPVAEPNYVPVAAYLMLLHQQVDCLNISENSLGLR